MHRRVASILTGMVVALVLVGAPAAPAAAQPIDPASAASSTQVSSVCSERSSLDYQYLPVERWSGATQELHVRPNGGMFDFAPVERQLQSVSFVIGDFLYGVTVKLVTWSTQFCPLQTVGGAVDQAGATLGGALVDSPLLVGLLVITMLVMLAQGVRNGDASWAKRLATKVAVLALFAIMVAGAAGSTGGGINGDYSTPYSPGRGSPGWFATTIDQVITQLAAGPASALSARAVVDATTSGDQLDCGPYMGALQKGYLEAATPTNGTLRTAAVPAMTVSNLWQISGYNAWSVGQFGNKNLNGHSRVGCRMLDRNAGIPVRSGSFVIDGADAVNNRSTASVTEVMSRVPEQRLPVAAAAQLIKPDAPAWRPLASPETDKAWIAWATCVPLDGKLANITRRDDWRAPAGNAWLIADESARANAEAVNGSPKLNAACYAFFNSDSATVDAIFDWGPGDKELNKHADQMPASVYDFVSALHGTNQGAGAIAGFAYVAAAVGVAGVFGGLGFGILLVKIIALVMLFSVFFAMAAVLLPNADNSRLVNYTKEYVGLCLFSAFSVFVMAMVTLFVKVIWLLLGNFTGGPNSVMTMLLGGLAPVMAAYALHRGFTKTGMPSPMTAKGASAWGTALAGGAAGGAVATGMGRIGSHASRLASRGKTLAWNQAKSKFGAGKGNQDPSTGVASQRSAIKGGGPPIPDASAGVAAARTPEQVLGDRNASPAAKRAAQRQLADERRAIKDEQRAANAAAAQARQAAEQEATMAGRAQQLAGRAQHAAGTVGAAAMTGAENRALDVRRWAATAAHHPVQSLAKVTHHSTVTAAALLGAGMIAGLPGVAVAAGGLAAKHGTTVVRRKIRDHTETQQAAIRAYRQAKAAERAATPAIPTPTPPLVRTPSEPGPPSPPTSDWADSLIEEKTGRFERPRPESLIDERPGMFDRRLNRADGGRGRPDRGTGRD